MESGEGVQSKKQLTSPIVIIGGALVILLFVGVLLFLNSNNDSQTNPTATQQPANQQKEGQGPQPTNRDAIQENVVTYSNSGYSPKTLAVKKGDTVTFKNQSSSPMWTASDVHPVHNEYPGSGISKCQTAERENIFDACRGIELGSKWSFAFSETGDWSFHNHLNPSQVGTIVVD